MHTMHLLAVRKRVFCDEIFGLPEFKLALSLITNQDADATQVPLEWSDEVMLLGRPLDPELRERILEKYHSLDDRMNSMGESTLPQEHFFGITGIARGQDLHFGTIELGLAPFPHSRHLTRHFTQRLILLSVPLFSEPKLCSLVAQQ